jgi:Leucine-rich repeat (LRR) protein
MNFNPFAENKIPSVSMFAKEKKKQIQATAEAVEDLEEKYRTEKYFGIEMNNETLAFFKELVGQVGERRVLGIIENVHTQFDEVGGLTKFDCSRTQITSLPKLPTGLMSLECQHTQITALPELPAGLKKLNCTGTKITSLPELPDGLTELICGNTQITSLPELPAGLKDLYCSSTMITSLPELPAGLEGLTLIVTPISKKSVLIDELKEKHPTLQIFI